MDWFDGKTRNKFISLVSISRWIDKDKWADDIFADNIFNLEHLMGLTLDPYHSKAWNRNDSQLSPKKKKKN